MKENNESAAALTPNSLTDESILTLKNEIEKTTKRLELEKQRLIDLADAIRKAKSEYEEKRFKCAANELTYNNIQHEKSLKMLENVASKELARYNICNAEISQTRTMIDKLRKDRLAEAQIFRSVNKEFVDCETSLKQLKQSFNENKHVVEKLTNRKEALTKTRKQERCKFEQAMLDARQKTKEQERCIRELDNKVSKETLQTVALLKSNAKFSSRIKAAKNIENLVKKTLKTSLLNSLQRCSIRNHRKQIETFEKAMELIKQSTEISDSAEVIELFVNLEKRNYSIINHVNKLKQEMEDIEYRKKAFTDKLKAQADHDERAHKVIEGVLNGVKHCTDLLFQQVDEKEAQAVGALRGIGQAKLLLRDCFVEVKQMHPDSFPICFSTTEIGSSDEDSPEKIMANLQAFIFDALPHIISGAIFTSPEKKRGIQKKERNAKQHTELSGGLTSVIQYPTKSEHGEIYGICPQSVISRQKDLQTTRQDSESEIGELYERPSTGIELRNRAKPAKKISCDDKVHHQNDSEPSKTVGINESLLQSKKNVSHLEGNQSFEGKWVNSSAELNLRFSRNDMENSKASNCLVSEIDNKLVNLTPTNRVGYSTNQNECFKDENTTVIRIGNQKINCKTLLGNGSSEKQNYNDENTELLSNAKAFKKDNEIQLCAPSSSDIDQGNFSEFGEVRDIVNVANFVKNSVIKMEFDGNYPEVSPMAKTFTFQDEIFNKRDGDKHNPDNLSVEEMQDVKDLKLPERKVSLSHTLVTTETRKEIEPVGHSNTETNCDKGSNGQVRQQLSHKLSLEDGSDLGEYSLHSDMQGSIQINPKELVGIEMTIQQAAMDNQKNSPAPPADEVKEDKGYAENISVEDNSVNEQIRSQTENEMNGMLAPSSSLSLPKMENKDATYYNEGMKFEKLPLFCYSKNKLAPAALPVKLNSKIFSPSHHINISLKSAIVPPTPKKSSASDLSKLYTLNTFFTPHYAREETPTLPDAVLVMSQRSESVSFNALTSIRPAHKLHISRESILTSCLDSTTKSASSVHEATQQHLYATACHFSVKKEENPLQSAQQLIKNIEVSEKSTLREFPGAYGNKVHQTGGTFNSILSNINSYPPDTDYFTSSNRQNYDSELFNFSNGKAEAQWTCAEQHTIRSDPYAGMVEAKNYSQPQTLNNSKYPHNYCKPFNTLCSFVESQQDNSAQCQNKNSNKCLSIRKKGLPDDGFTRSLLVSTVLSESPFIITLLLSHGSSEENAKSGVNQNIHLLPNNAIQSNELLSVTKSSRISARSSSRVTAPESLTTNVKETCPANFFVSSPVSIENRNSIAPTDLPGEMDLCLYKKKRFHKIVVKQTTNSSVLQTTRICRHQSIPQMSEKPCDTNRYNSGLSRVREETAEDAFFDLLTPQSDSTKETRKDFVTQLDSADTVCLNIQEEYHICCTNNNLFTSPLEIKVVNLPGFAESSINFIGPLVDPLEQIFTQDFKREKACFLNPAMPKYRVNDSLVCEAENSLDGEFVVTTAGHSALDRSHNTCYLDIHINNDAKFNSNDEDANSNQFRSGLKNVIIYSEIKSSHKHDGEVSQCCTNIKNVLEVLGNKAKRCAEASPSNEANIYAATILNADHEQSNNPGVDSTTPDAKDADQSKERNNYPVFSTARSTKETSSQNQTPFSHFGPSEDPIDAGVIRRDYTDKVKTSLRNNNEVLKRQSDYENASRRRSQNCPLSDKDGEVAQANKRPTVTYTHCKEHIDICMADSKNTKDDDFDDRQEPSISNTVISAQSSQKNVPLLVTLPISLNQNAKNRNVHTDIHRITDELPAQPDKSGDINQNSCYENGISPQNQKYEEYDIESHSAGVNISPNIGIIMAQSDEVTIASTTTITEAQPDEEMLHPTGAYTPFKEYLSICTVFPDKIDVGNVDSPHVLGRANILTRKVPTGKNVLLNEATLASFSYAEDSVDEAHIPQTKMQLACPNSNKEVPPSLSDEEMSQWARSDEVYFCDMLPQAAKMNIRPTPAYTITGTPTGVSSPTKSNTKDAVYLQELNHSKTVTTTQFSQEKILHAPSVTIDQIKKPWGVSMPTGDNSFQENSFSNNEKEFPGIRRDNDKAFIAQSQSSKHPMSQVRSEGFSINRSDEPQKNCQKMLKKDISIKKIFKLSDSRLPCTRRVILSNETCSKPQPEYSHSRPSLNMTTSLPSHTLENKAILSDSLALEPYVSFRTKCEELVAHGLNSAEITAKAINNSMPTDISTKSFYISNQSSTDCKAFYVEMNGGDKAEEEEIDVHQLENVILKKSICDKIEPSLTNEHCYAFIEVQV